MKKINHKKVNEYSRILFLLTLSLFLVSCLNWIVENPSFYLREVILSPHSLTDMDIILGLEVQNPNRFDLTLKSFEYSVYFNNEKIGNGRMEKEFLIPSSSTTRMRMPVAAKFKDLGGGLKTIIAGNDIVYKIEGKTCVKTNFSSFNFLFSKEGHINIRK